jgi:hypothetical protein
VIPADYGIAKSYAIRAYIVPVRTRNEHLNLAVRLAAKSAIALFYIIIRHSEISLFSFPFEGRVFTREGSLLFIKGFPPAPFYFFRDYAAETFRKQKAFPRASF